MYERTAYTGSSLRKIVRVFHASQGGLTQTVTYLWGIQLLLCHCVALYPISRLPVTANRVLYFPSPRPHFFSVSNKPDGLCGRKAPCLLFTYCKWTVCCHDHLDRPKFVGNGSDRIYRQAGNLTPVKQIVVNLIIIPVMDFCCRCSTCQLIDHCKLALSRNLNGVRKYYGVPFMRREQECHVTLILSA